jgi:hypothetical protein
MPIYRATKQTKVAQPIEVHGENSQIVYYFIIWYIYHPEVGVCAPNPSLQGGKGQKNQEK